MTTVFIQTYLFQFIFQFTTRIAFVAVSAALIHLQRAFELLQIGAQELDLLSSRRIQLEVVLEVRMLFVVVVHHPLTEMITDIKPSLDIIYIIFENLINFKDKRNQILIPIIIASVLVIDYHEFIWHFENVTDVYVVVAKHHRRVYGSQHGP